MSTAYDPILEMQVFDALPFRLREILRNTGRQYGAVQVRDLLGKYPEPQVAAIIAQNEALLCR